ncbi:MAG: hypothetical protein BWX80_03502 [Candidatus Hydrogenedentes bacterium ADurb.Bin101]|nr:MAG: hypothetical protein BWX80_03502 [Candidatus Hydrogenedentes bacterium ADurb.Bin101]
MVYTVGQKGPPSILRLMEPPVVILRVKLLSHPSTVAEMLTPYKVISVANTRFLLALNALRISWTRAGGTPSRHASTFSASSSKDQW